MQPSPLIACLHCRPTCLPLLYPTYLHLL